MVNANQSFEQPGPGVFKTNRFSFHSESVSDYPPPLQAKYIFNLIFRIKYYELWVWLLHFDHLVIVCCVHYCLVTVDLWRPYALVIPTPRPIPESCPLLHVLLQQLTPLNYKKKPILNTCSRIYFRMTLNLYKTFTKIRFKSILILFYFLTWMRFGCKLWQPETPKSCYSWLLHWLWLGRNKNVWHGPRSDR